MSLLCFFFPFSYPFLCIFMTNILNACFFGKHIVKEGWRTREKEEKGKGNPFSTCFQLAPSQPGVDSLVISTLWGLDLLIFYDLVLVS